MKNPIENSGQRNPRLRRRQRGVTLVELMISLVLGMVLTAGIIKVFVGNRSTFAFNQSLSRIQENARYTLNHIAYNTRMAGYSGCLSDVTIHNNLDPDTPNAFRDDIENGVKGYDYNGTADTESYASDPAGSTDDSAWTPELPEELSGKVIPGSDVLVVRNISADAQSLISPFDDSSQLYVGSTTNFAEGEILVASDCQKASIFQLTGIAGTSTKQLVHSDLGSFTPGNGIATWGIEQTYGLGSQVARLETYAFYVGQGDDGPTLFQTRLDGNSFTTEELVGGIESLQVRYGVDSDHDASIDDWKSADAVTDWTAVVSVEVNLLARALEEYGTDTDTVVYTLGGMTFNPVDDRRLRQVFSTTIGIRNRLP